MSTNRRELITKTLLVLYGLAVAAFLLVEDGTALGRPGLTSVGIAAVIAVALAICLAAVACLFVAP